MTSRDITVLQDTLVESDYSREEAEEIVARVLSVVDSTDHFISQFTTVLEDVSCTSHQKLGYITHTRTFCVCVCVIEKGRKEREKHKS